jgi:hypothetical protein
MRTYSRRLACALAALCLLGTPAAARAQAHERHAGPYTLRASTVGSESISAQTAKAHGIERSPSRALINVTLMRNGKTVPARLTVHARNLAGMSRPIDMRPTPANGYISYDGVYEFVNGEVLDFTIRAQPEGRDQAVTLGFRDRMWRQGDIRQR